MENQPTAILMVFTDFLNNRDSLAFLRLSSSILSAHHSPQGRYRLKTSKDRKFWRPSDFPQPRASPDSGDFPDLPGFLVSQLEIIDFSDFSLFLSSVGEVSSEAGHLKSSNILSNVKDLVVHLKGLETRIREGWKIPAGVERISLIGFYNESLSFSELREILPAGVKSLDLSQCHEMENSTVEMIDFSGFPELEELKFWPSFNFPLQSIIFPSSLRRLHLNGIFNLPIEGLPDSIVEMEFGDSSPFNCPLPSKMPKNLKFLHLGENFDCFIRPGQLPAGLKTIIFSQDFNKAIDCGIFPQGIEKIVFNLSSFNQPCLPGIFPNSLKSLDFICPQYSHPIGILPESLEILTIGLCRNYRHVFPPLPSGLKSFTFNDSLSSLVDSLDNFPPQLLSLQLRSFSHWPLGKFPPSIENIDFGARYNEPSNIGMFHVGIKRISFGHAFDQPLPVGIFPQGLLTIKLGEKYSHPLDVGLFPSSVRKLKISTSHPLPIGVFPDGVESIEFCKGFSQPLLPGIFPSSLRSLTFGDSFSGDFLPGVLPEFLCELDLSSYFLGYLPLSSLPLISLMISLLFILTFLIA